MSALANLLTTFRNAAMTEREKGTYFEDLIVCYLRNEATYSDLYSDVWTYAEWAESQGLDKRDTGIDLVAKTRGTDEYHAIQCKLYAETYKLRKEDIGTVSSFVLGLLHAHLENRSPKMMANWVLASIHSRGGRFQSCAK